MSEVYRGLGLDMAYRNTGWAIFKVEMKSSSLKPTLEKFGVITNSNKIKELNGLARIEALHEECKDYYSNLYRLITENNIATIAAEMPYGAQSKPAAIAMGMVYGAMSFIKINCPWIEIRLIHPNDSKAMVNQDRRGTCSKALVSLWAKRVHKELPPDVSDHITDAVAAWYVYWTNTKSKIPYQKQKRGLSASLIKSEEIDI
jgi:Holliday junction resolvasome RuvABC endonuclease subunit